jgi:hypothetical protein
MLVIREVQSRSDIESFIRVPWPIYSTDQYWVPPLRAHLRDCLNRTKNPYFEHAEAAFFLAQRGDRVVGRISAQVCQLAQRYHGRGTGHFGFFECEDQPEDAAGLFQAAENWLASRGMTRLMGPFSLSINDEVGTLVNGFHRAPSVLMGHHRPYYDGLIRSAGFAKEMDLYSYQLDDNNSHRDRLHRILNRFPKDRFTLRSVDRSETEEALRHVLDVFRESWTDNWGYIPPTDAEVDYLVRSIDPLIQRGLVILGEIDGELAGMMVTLPNLNESIADLDGKLFPSGWLRLLWRLKFHRFQSVRVPLLGLRKKHHRTRTGMALALAMIERSHRTFVDQGVQQCEMSWILENNASMRGIIETLGSSVDKTYRIYAKELVPQQSQSLLTHGHRQRRASKQSEFPVER